MHVNHLENVLKHKNRFNNRLILTKSNSFLFIIKVKKNNVTVLAEYIVISIWAIIFVLGPRFFIIEVIDKIKQISQKLLSLTHIGIWLLSHIYVQIEISACRQRNNCFLYTICQLFCYFDVDKWQDLLQNLFYFINVIFLC